MIGGPLKWYTIAYTLMTEIRDSLTTQVERAGVVPGRIAWDGCDCGALYVSVGIVHPSETFPEQRGVADISDACGAPYEVAEIIIQLMRCAPMPQGQNLSPSPEDLDISAQIVRQDGYEAMRAANLKLCTMRDTAEIENFIIDTQQAAGPQGGCVGTELRLRVGLDRN